MDKKAIVHLWIQSPFYFSVPLTERLDQLNAMVRRKQEYSNLLHVVRKTAILLEKETDHGS